MREAGYVKIIGFLAALHDFCAPRAFYALYDFLLIAALLLSTPLIIYKSAREEPYRKGLMERFGAAPEAADGRECVWIHASSVGEVLAGRLLAEKLKESGNDYRVVVSSFTAAGRMMAAEKIPGADAVFSLPFDLSFLVRRAVRRVKPSVIVLVETDLWPNLIRCSDEMGVRIMLSSGALSEQSRRIHARFNPAVYDMLSRIDHFNMQSDVDVDRVVSLGADRRRTVRGGNIKFDRSAAGGAEDISGGFNTAGRFPVIAAGSTHRGEEEQLIPFYKALKAKFPGLLLVIAPRYIGRIGEIEALFRRDGLRTVRRTLPGEKTDEDILLLDTMGELYSVYAFCDLVFVGGSLVNKGGHNIMEAVAHGNPVFFGPHMHDFEQEKDAVLSRGLGFQVEDAHGLAAAMDACLSDPGFILANRDRALDFIRDNQGASAGNIRAIESLVRKGPSVAVIRLSSLGDVVHALPAARSLRAGCPDGELTWIVEKGFAGLVAANPYLDGVVAMPRTEWATRFRNDRLGALTEALRFFEGLRRRHFDISIDLHGILKSSLTSFLSGAVRRIGPGDGREGSVFFYNKRIPALGAGLHQVERSLYLARAAGGRGGEADFGIVVSEAAAARVGMLFSSCGIDRSRPMAVLNPFTTWESKDWVEEKWAALADRLAAERSYEVVFTGSSRDRPGIERIVKLMAATACVLAGETGLLELAGVCAEADLFIGGDTGPTHLAAAMGARAVALMGPTSPRTHGPFGAKSAVVQKKLRCSGCWKRVCPRGTGECMAAISVEDVMDAVGGL